MVFGYDPDADEPGEQFIYIYTHLAAQGFWRRLVTGLRYIFGYKCKYGHFDEVVIGPETALELWDFICGFYSNTREKRNE